jgi:hypothetical protein
MAADVNQRDLEALEAAARQYRVAVYETYRLDRAEYDRRRAAADELQARWREAGGRKEELTAVLKWLERATYLSRPEVRQSLPALPGFGMPGMSRGDAAKSEAGTREMLPPPPPRVGNEPYVQRRPPPAPKVNGYQIAPTRQFAPPAMSHNIITPPSAQAQAGAQRGPAPVANQPQVDRALLPAPWEVVTPAPSRSAVDVSTVPRRRADVGTPPTPTRVERPARVAGLADAALPQSTSTASQLNVGEILARASGYGFGLRTIESVLHDQASLDAEDLSRLLGELEALVEQRGDLLLYEQLLSAEVRQRLVASLDFPQTTVATLGSRIAAARERLTQESSLAAGEREVRLQSLADLSRRLSRLSQK